MDIEGQERPGSGHRTGRRTGFLIGAAALVALALAGWWPARGPTPDLSPRDTGEGLPDDLRTQALAGRHLLDKATRADAEHALPLFENVLVEFPLHTATLSDYSLALARSGRLFEARRVVSTALATSPEYGPAWEVRGYLALLDWRTSDAHLDFLQAVRLSPDIARHHRSLAYVLALRGRLDDAERSMGEALRLDPGSAALHADAGVLAYWRQQYETSADYCRTALELSDERTRLRPARCLFRAHAALGETKEARAWASHILAAGGLNEDEVEALWRSGDDLQPYWRWAAQDENLTLSQGAKDPYAAALAYADAGNGDRALLRLQQALAEREPRLVQLVLTPRLELVKDEPRFRRLVALVQRADRSTRTASTF